MTFFNADQILSRGRYAWVDYARGICILLVCYRHVFEGLAHVGVGPANYPILQYLNVFFFSFRMPLFFIIAGIFFGGSITRKGPVTYINDRFSIIFYPLLVWGIIQISLQLALSDYVNVRREPIDYLNLLIRPRAIEQFWYLNALFFVGVLYAMIKVYAKFKPWHQLLLGLLLYGIGSYCYLHHIEIGFLVDVLFFYMFFSIGDLISDFILNANNYKILSSFRTLALLLPAFGLMQYYFTALNLSYKNDYYVQTQLPVLFAITALIGGTFIIIVSFILQKLDILRFLRIIGYHSLYIYLVHLLVTAATRIVMVKIFNVQSIPVLMIVGISAGIIIPIIFYNAIQSAGAWWLFSLKKRPLSPVKTNSLFYEAHMITPKESTTAGPEKPEN